MKCPTCARDVSDPLGDEAKYIESLRARADDAKASADHRALVIGDLTRKLEAAKKRIEELEKGLRSMTKYTDEICETWHIWEKLI